MAATLTARGVVDGRSRGFLHVVTHDVGHDVARAAKSPKSWLGVGAAVAFVLGLPMIIGLVLSLFELPRYLRLKMK